ncbi:NAD(P)-dependent oxidoreductase [Desulfocicer niacini]
MNTESQNPRVIICDPIAKIGIDMLETHCTVDINPGLTESQLMEIIPNYDAAVVRSATKFPKAVIEKATNLKVIGRAGAGLDSIDVKTAKERGIALVNSPNANSVAVAEHVFGLMFALIRHLPRANASLKESRWEKKNLMGTGLAGKTLGLVGFGRIARQVASRALAFGMNVQVSQRRATPEKNAKLGVETVDLKTLFSTSDFISVHIPGKPENDDFVGKELISHMKPTAYMINTARGTVLDETALLDALNKERIAGAALDVFKVEPAVDNPLVAHDKVIVSPHIAASTDDAQQSAAVTIVEQILDILVESAPENPLDLMVLPMDKVFPHELTDPRRVDNLIEKLNASDVFTNPPIVTPCKEYYVVLDGATRVAAFKKLGYPHIIVQVMKDPEKFSLDTWFHAIRKIDVDALLKLLGEIPEISIVKSDQKSVQAEMVEHGGLCFLQTVDKTIYHIQPMAGVNHLEALNKLTDAYIQASHVTRTLHDDIDALLAEFPDLTGVVLFPVLTLEQVLQIADAGHVVPAGITRFIIPGRVMRLNADFEYLKSDKALDEKNQWLYDLVMEKLSKDQARYYAEPIYLMDE